MAFKIFKNSGFFEKFHIREEIFLNYFTALEAGYNDIPCKNDLSFYLFLDFSRKLKQIAVFCCQITTVHMQLMYYMEYIT